MKEKTPLDCERFKQEVMEGLYAGKRAGSTDGFALLMKHLLESMLNGERDCHPPQFRIGVVTIIQM